jgi:phosphoglycolate phosphatase-like HAD superfamily hydrolase
MPRPSHVNRSPTQPIRAVVWDFDNTLIDTRAKNLSVTRRIIERVTERSADEFPVLRSLAAYDAAIHHTQNWQTLYEVEFGLVPELIQEAGGLWTGYQLDDPTPTRWFGGIPEVVRALSHLPQAIVSMNTRANILEGLSRADLAGEFDLVIGCEEVKYNRQKPAPDGLIHCMEELAVMEAATVVYVGDHPVDAQCASNANAVLAGGEATARVVAIGALYGTAVRDGAWPVKPDHEAATPHEVLEIVLQAATAPEGEVPSAG